MVSSWQSSGGPGNAPRRSPAGEDLDAGAIVVFTNDNIQIRRLPIQT